MDETRLRDIVDLAIAKNTETEIARTLHMDRKAVRGYLRFAESQRFLSLLFGGGRGRTKVFGPGPLYGIPQPMTSGSSSSPSTSEIPVARLHFNMWKVPVFEDELLYREHPDLPPKRWTVASWTADYAREPWEAKGARFYEFKEPSGRWRLCILTRPRTVRGPRGRTQGRDRTQVATVVLWPLPSLVGASQLDRGPEITFDDAVSLLRDIRDNKKLALHALPEPTSDREVAFDLEDHPSIPQGRTELGPGIWVDRSPRCPRCRTPLGKDESGTLNLVCRKCGYKASVKEATRPEAEVRVPANDFSKAKGLVIALEALQAAPGLGDDMAQVKADLRALRVDVDEILRILKSR